MLFLIVMTSCSLETYTTRKNNSNQEILSYLIENNIDVFIDDHVDFCEGVSKNGTKVFMFDSPYNKEETRYKRVYSWNEIYNEIKK